MPSCVLLSSRSPLKEPRCSCDELTITGRECAIGKDRRVLKSCPDPVPSVDGSLVHGPGGDAVAVMDLLDQDILLQQEGLDGFGVGDRDRRVRIQRLDHCTYALLSEAPGNESLGIGERQQTGLDADAARHELLCQFANAFFPLIGRHQIRKLSPPGDDLGTSNRIWLDASFRAQGDRDARAGGPHGAEGGGAVPCLEGLVAFVVVRVEMQSPGACLNSRRRFDRQL